MGEQSSSGTDCRADPGEVDRDRTLALGDCPECGDNSLATATVEDAVYIASCGVCDHEIRAPVVVSDGETVVKFDADPEDYPLRSVQTDTEQNGDSDA